MKARWAVVLFAIATVGAAVLLVSQRHDVEGVLKAADEAVESHRVVNAAEMVYSDLSAAISALRGYFITRNPAFSSTYDDSLYDLRDSLDRLTGLTTGTGLQDEIHELRSAIEERMSWLERGREEFEQSGIDASRSVLTQPALLELTERIRRVIEQIRADKHAQLAAELSQIRRERDRIKRISELTLVAVLGLMIAALLMLVAEIRAKERQIVARAAQRLELARKNYELRQQAGELKAALHDLEGFSYSVSHDLRSPLRAVEGFSAMLEEDCGQSLDDEGRRYISVIRDGARRMNQLITDLLAFARLGREPLARSRFDVRKLVEQCVEEALASHAGKPPTIVIGELPPAKADPKLLRHVWGNLISNAVKYSAKRDSPRIEISGQREASGVRYVVRDNGAGFDMKYAHKLFKAFQRLHGPSEFIGTGVGLAIAERVVLRHGGSVGAEGRPGEGAEFWFSIPDEGEVTSAKELRA